MIAGWIVLSRLLKPSGDSLSLVLMAWDKSLHDTQKPVVLNYRFCKTTYSTWSTACGRQHRQNDVPPPRRQAYRSSRICWTSLFREQWKLVLVLRKHRQSAIYVKLVPNAGTFAVGWMVFLRFGSIQGRSMRHQVDVHQSNWEVIMTFRLHTSIPLGKRLNTRAGAQTECHILAFTSIHHQIGIDDKFVFCGALYIANIYPVKMINQAHNR